VREKMKKGAAVAVSVAFISCGTVVNMLYRRANCGVAHVTR